MSHLVDTLTTAHPGFRQLELPELRNSGLLRLGPSGLAFACTFKQSQVQAKVLSFIQVGAIPDSHSPFRLRKLLSLS